MAQARHWQGYRREILIVLAVLLAGCSGEEVEPAQPRAVATLTLREADGLRDMVYPGEVRSAYETEIGFEVAGRIVARTVNAGARVAAGQLLFRIDPADYRRGLDSAAAQAAAAGSTARAQAADLARGQELLAQGFISPAEFDQQRASTDQARAQLRVANAQRADAATQLARTTLEAPRAGIVTRLSGEVGQVVPAGQGVLTLADPARIEIALDVAEGNVAALSDAQEITVSAWSRPDRRYRARLVSVAGAADPATRTFAARVAVDGAGGELRLGETAQVHVERPAATAGDTGDAVALPLKAVGGKGRDSMVWVVDRTRMIVRWRQVRIVGTQGNDLLVTGVRSGETVVTAGGHLLRDGEQVRIATVPAA